MNRITRLLALLGFAYFAFARGANAAEKPALTFAGQDFSLAFVNFATAGVINEYVLPGEKVQTWTSLVTVQQAPEVKDPVTIAEAVLKVSTGNDSLASKPVVMYREGTKNSEDIILLLLIRDPAHGGTELNLQRYVKEPGSIGVKTYIFARRIPTGTDNPTPEQMNTWIKALWELKADTFKAMP